MICTCYDGADSVVRILWRLAMDPDSRYRDDSKARVDHTCPVHGAVVLIAWRRSVEREKEDDG